MTARRAAELPPDRAQMAAIGEDGLRAIFDSAPTGMILTSLDGVFLRVNPAFCTLCGASPEALLGKNHREITHPADQPLEQAHTERLLRGERQTVQIEKRYLHPGNLPVWAHLSLSLVRDRAGQPWGLAGHVQDISERHAGASFRQRLLDILDTASDFIASLHPDGRLFYLNRAGMQMLGLPEGSDPATLRLEDLHPADGVRYLREKVLPAILIDGHWEGETEILCRDGHRIPLSQSFFAHCDGHGRVDSLSTIGRDISQQKGFEQELREAKERAELASRAKSAFLANVSHELRTPLNAILGFSDLLGRTAERELQHNYLRAIQASSKNLLLLINDILDLTRIDAGQMQVRRLPTEPAALLREVRQLFALAAVDKGLAFETRLDPRLPPRLLLDQVRLRQVLVHLTGNAVKFTDQGRVCVAMGLGSGSPAPTGATPLDLVITVEDSGRGIAEADRQSLFAPFKQQDEAITRRHGGTGLGLALTKRLVELMGGEIRVEGAPGQGSRFSILLHGVAAADPAAPAEGDEGLPPREETPMAAATSGAGLSAELAEELGERYLRRWERISRSHFFDEIADFATALGTLAARHRCPPLADYAVELATHARNFDIPRMDKLLHDYPQFILRLGCPPPGG
jgi:PAS domain S-box-containing protein